MSSFASGFFVLGAVAIAYIILGLFMIKFPPKKINYFYGYRTPGSMKSQNRWNFAQIYSAKEFIKSGIGVLIISSILYSVTDTFIEPLLVGILIVISVIIPVLKTELALKKKF